MQQSHTGAVNASENVRQRNRHVPRLHTHIGYVSLIAARALPDDFFVRPDADIGEASPLLRNLTPTEPLPLHAEMTPDALLAKQIGMMMSKPDGRIGPEHLKFLIAANRITNSRMHVLQKMGLDLNDFWKDAIDDFTAGTERLRAEGVEPGLSEAYRLAAKAVRVAEDKAPGWRKDVMNGFVWSLLNDEARLAFKSIYKSLKKTTGAAEMYRFVRHLEENGLLSLETELAGNDRQLRVDVSRELLSWLIQPVGTSV